MRPAKMFVRQGNDGLWYWHMKAGNGRVIADSAEGYTRKADAIIAAERVKAAAPDAVVVDTE